MLSLRGLERLFSGGLEAAVTGGFAPVFQQLRQASSAFGVFDDALPAADNPRSALAAWQCLQEVHQPVLEAGLRLHKDDKAVGTRRLGVEGTRAHNLAAHSLEHLLGFGLHELLQLGFVALDGHLAAE